MVNYRRTGRVQGYFTVSRAIDDAHFKQRVAPYQDTRITSRTLLFNPRCEFLLLASGSMWITKSHRHPDQLFFIMQLQKFTCNSGRN
jgi:hypothetical protein